MLDKLLGGFASESDAHAASVQAGILDQRSGTTSSLMAFEYQPSSNQAVLLRKLKAPDRNVPSQLHLIWSSYEVKGKLEADRLEGALQHMAFCHEAFRTFFACRNDVMVACVQPYVQLKLERVKTDPGALEGLLCQLGSKPFDLGKPPLLRLALVDAGSRQFLVFAAHHLIFDGWSYNVFWEQLDRFYVTPTSEWSRKYPNSFLPYSSYANWERSRVDLPESTESLAYWRRKLLGLPGSITLPTRTTGRPARFTYRGNSVHWTAGYQILSRARIFAASQHTTLYMVLLSAFYWALRVMSGQLDLFVRCPLAGRTTVEQEQSIGYYARSLVMRVVLERESTLDSVFHATCDAVFEALSHHAVTRSALALLCGPRLDDSYGARLPIQFIHQWCRHRSELTLGSCVLEKVRFNSEQELVHTDLSVYVTESDNDLHVEFSYCCDVYEEQMIRSLYDNFKSALDTLCR